MEQVFHVLFNPIDGSDDNDEEDGEKDEDLRLIRRDDDNEMAELMKNHVKRAFVAYTVTKEIKIRQQLEIILPGQADIYCSVDILSLFVPPGAVSCAPAFTAGNLQWEPGAAKPDKAGREKARGPKEAGNKKAGSGKDAWGYTIWPMDVAVVMWINIGVGTIANL